ncbi:helix-turn-helix domain-containing protein [Colwellia psychrerythraea]|uniref:Putative DNA-binding protein n=1 Tax=Colwellia psychrerythraea (strain 34H / ATCC BAA-681) TaxID=167879 RepID=Q485A9_COLP3|nr:helix-turn-helix transcriptional regulator [Colwellia psychrerythraea]AAZ26886.1 putative DNA-binding protein [Colwellia psychrerythraea 34H]
MFARIESGKIIAQKRKELGKTQKVLAEETNVNKSIISQIENGKFSGSLRVYEKYINGLGLELAVRPIKSKIPDFDNLHHLFPDE